MIPLGYPISSVSSSQPVITSSQYLSPPQSSVEPSLASSAPSPSPSPSSSVASGNLDYEAWVNWAKSIDNAAPLPDPKNFILASSSDSTVVKRSFYLEPVSGQTSSMQLIPVSVHSGQPSGVLSNSSDDPAISFKPSSSSSSGASSAVSASESSSAGAQRIPKRITKKKKRNKIDQFFPEQKYFHPFFKILYPVGSEIKYLNDKGKLVQGVIEEIWIDPSGVPLVRIENQWVEFKHLFAPDLKRNNNAMVFTKGFSKHVAAEVTGFIIKNTDAGLMRSYNMRTTSLNSIEFKLRLDNTDKNQLYRVIPFILNRAAKVQEALKKVWSEFNHINEDD